MKRTHLDLVVLRCDGEGVYAVIRPPEWVPPDDGYGWVKDVIETRSARLPASEIEASLRTSVAHNPNLTWVRRLIAAGDELYATPQVGAHPYR